MRFLADESCDFAVVRALRLVGHDVLAVSELQQRSVDPEVMEMAYRDDRVLLTEDKDFGWLAFVAHADNPGVRHPPRSGWLDELGRLKGGRAVGLGVARCAPYWLIQNCPTAPSAASCSRMY